MTVVDGVDTASHANKKARQINSLVNEWYSEELSENIRAVFRRKMEAGQFLGNYAPYGYRKDPCCRHHLIPDAETAPVVEKIYDLYLSGLSCKMIGERLTAQGIPTPSEMSGARGGSRQAFFCGMVEGDNPKNPAKPRLSGAYGAGKRGKNQL